MLHSEEPVLVDTGLGFDRDTFIDALASVIDPSAIRWIWLTHDDADHTGNIERVFQVAPNATLVCHGMAAMRMSSWWPVPMDRVRAIRVGDRLPVGDRTLLAVAPPLFDNPMSTGFLDEATGALFSVDSFGAIIPESTDNAEEIPADALAGGMAGWATVDSPWAHIVDRTRFSAVLDGVRQLKPTTILSSHLPAAHGTSMERFLSILETVPDAEPAHAPSHEEFGFMLEAMAAPAPA
ncbi:MAG TPA: MBL fold metallo-hydrolase [Acidimicrobiales bacterium]|nr:MBL fold metallo-hydrolase [Acidimicrobiales bacterium]